MTARTLHIHDYVENGVSKQGFRTISLAKIVMDDHVTDGCTVYDTVIVPPRYEMDPEVFIIPHTAVALQQDPENAPEEAPEGVVFYVPNEDLS